MRSAYLVKARQRRNQAVGSNNAEEPAKNSQQLQGPSNPRKQNHTSPDPDPPMSVQDTMNSAEDPIFVEDPASNKPQTRNFLPIAMPRPDPPEEGAEIVREYGSVFEAPDVIAVPSGGYFEAGQHEDDDDDGLSAMSGLTGLNTLGTFTQHKASQYSNQSGQMRRDNQFRGEESRSRRVDRELSKRLQLQRHNGHKLGSPRNRIAHYRNKFASQQNRKQLTCDTQIRPIVCLNGAQEVAVATQDCAQEVTQEVEDELRKLPSLEEVLDGVESKVFNPIPRSAPQPMSRHGLPYEPTDYNADEEDSVVDPWDRAITPNSKAKAQARSFKRDPEECDDLNDQIQCPPTPRRHLSDSVYGRVRETLSPRGDVVIDITDIEDEDIEPFSRSRSNSNDYQTAALSTSTRKQARDITDVEDADIAAFSRSRSNSNDYQTTALSTSTRKQARDITDIEDIERCLRSESNSNNHHAAADSTSTRKQANNVMRGNPASAHKFLRLRQMAQGTRPVEDLGSSGSTKKVDVHRAQSKHDNNSSGTFLSISLEAESDHEQLVGESLAGMDDDEITPNVTPDMEINIESRDEEPERIQEEEEGVFSSSFAYFKSMANDLGSQLQSIDLSSKLESIQNSTLLSDKEIGKMLGVLEKGLKDTSDKTPEKRDPYLSFLAAGLEKTACGIDRTCTQGENDYILSDQQVESSATRAFQFGDHHEGEPTGLLQKHKEGIARTTQGENGYVSSSQEVESSITGAFQCGDRNPAPHQGEPTGLLQKRMEGRGIKPSASQTYSVSINDEVEQLRLTVSME
jgi:hypothetical protein